MNRRTSLKSLLAAAGSIVTLPAWAEAWDVKSLEAPSGSVISDSQLLASVVDTIIPAGDSIGALSVGVDKFLQKLFAQCYEKDVQQIVATQLKALDEKAKSTVGKSFVSCDQTQRETLLNALAASQDQDEKAFFDLMKSETIRGFSTSREVMLNYLNYKILPGHFYGCVDVNA